MGLLLILGILAIPLILVGLLTKWRGNAPPNATDDEWAPARDPTLGISKQQLGREMTDVERD